MIYTGCRCYCRRRLRVTYARTRHGALRSPGDRRFITFEHDSATDRRDRISDFPRGRPR